MYNSVNRLLYIALVLPSFRFRFFKYSVTLTVGFHITSLSVFIIKITKFYGPRNSTTPTFVHVICEIICASKVKK